MKILYAIQATGNGHVSRAKEILPLLEKHGKVDILLSGTQADLRLTQTVKFAHHGFSFIFGKKGGVDHWETWKTMDLPLFIRNVKALPLKDYNLVINDFEPVTAWACKLKKIESVGLSHQASFQSSLVPKPKSIDWAQLVLKHYAPASHYVGFHFQKYDDFIFTPVIRSEIRNLITSNLGHYTVYLPAIEEKILLPILKQVPVEWQVFSKHAKHDYTDGNVKISIVNNEKFNKSLASCAGLLTGGGFESPAEALFLGKKLLVAPMKFQYEQQCNAFALKKLGFPVIWGSNRNWLPIIKQWVNDSQEHALQFPDETEQIVNSIVSRYAK
jgi:uncharacterized protein (TIGR00661 family)